MCFSAGASLGAGAVLTVIGVASIKKAHHPSQLLFASIPLFFGVQQIAEGVLWLTLSNPDYVNTQKIFTYIYLLFAQTLWPIWVPISILLMEKNATRKNIQRVLSIIGILVGVYFTYCLLMFTVEAKIDGQHIKYFLDYPSSMKDYSYVLYGLVIIAPPFFSHIKRMWVLGIGIIASYVITHIFYDQYSLSVWCFFAAIISISTYVIMVEISNAERQNSLTDNQ